MINYKNAFYKKYATTINLQNQISDISYNYIKKKFNSFSFYYKNLLPNKFDSKILDIGCGEGNFVAYLNQLGYSDVKGIDISEEQIKLGKQLGIKNIELYDLKVYLKETNFKFDYIVARDIFEHFTKAEIYEILSSIYKLLKPNGLILIQVPNAEGLNFCSHFYGDFTHETAFTNKSLKQVALNIGFKSIFIKPVNPYSSNIFLFLFRSLFWYLYVLHLRFRKFIETGNHNGVFTSNIIVLLGK
jgi:2-polyprenyl-3-methyl-5-hydroxy-6-metoxy-1,4-benzoquinol methylase